jgi:membrane protein DedA with SNARE-associated domain
LRPLDRRVTVLTNPTTARSRPLLGGIEDAILSFIENTYDVIGWPGVVLLSAIESMGIPLPSEIILPLAGWMLIKDEGHGWEWLFFAGFCGALGNTIGSVIAYYIGLIGGRPLIEKYGKYILISHHDLDLADRFFQRWGNWAVFGSRLLPVVRTFISFPAGIARMPIVQFIIYTFLGAFLWSLALAAGGYQLGENWEDLRRWMRPFDIPIIIITLILIGLYVYRHVKRAWGDTAKAQAES